jgi:hypothetical protein
MARPHGQLIRSGALFAHYAMTKQSVRVAAGAAVAAAAGLMAPPADAAPAVGPDVMAATDAQSISCPDAKVGFIVEFTRETGRAHITRWYGGFSDPAPPSATLTSSYNGSAYAIAATSAQGTGDSWYLVGEGSAYADYGSQITMWVTYGDVPLFLCTTSIKK